MTGKVVYFIAFLHRGIVEFETRLIAFERNSESGVAYLRGVHAIVVYANICHLVSF